MDNNSKGKLEKLQKYEPVIAGIALFIGLALFAGFIISFVVKTNKDAEQFVIRTSSAYYENSAYADYFDEDELDVSVSSDGVEIVEKYELYGGVFLTADSSGITVLVNGEDKHIENAVFISDDGQRISAVSDEKGVEFINQEKKLTKFTLNGHAFAFDEQGFMTIDGYKMISDKAAVPVTTTVTTTAVETTTTEETTTTAPPETTAVSSKETPKPTTTTKKPATTTTKATTTEPPKTTTTPKPTTTAIPEYKTDDKFVAEVLKLVNAERKKAGLKELKGMIALDKAAQIRASEITGADENFSHTRPSGQKWYTILAERKISYHFAGENLAAGQSTPEMVVADWMASPDHKANILDPDFQYMGVGYVKYEGYLYWAQLFISIN